MCAFVHPIERKLLGDAKEAQRGAALVSSRAWKKHSAPEAECFCAANYLAMHRWRHICWRSGAAPTWRWPAGTSNHIETNGLPNCSHALLRSLGEISANPVPPIVRLRGLRGESKRNAGSPRRRLAPHTIQKIKKSKERAEGTGA
jgi:hypothetical protein